VSCEVNSLDLIPVVSDWLDFVFAGAAALRLFYFVLQSAEHATCSYQLSAGLEYSVAKFV
jgi:hypothetical protein